MPGRHEADRVRRWKGLAVPLLQLAAGKPKHLLNWAERKNKCGQHSQCDTEIGSVREVRPSLNAAVDIDDIASDAMAINGAAPAAPYRSLTFGSPVTLSATGTARVRAMAG